METKDSAGNILNDGDIENHLGFFNISKIILQPLIISSSDIVRGGEIRIAVVVNRK